MVENDSRINIDLIIKLFDMLKESDTTLRYQVDKQTDAIVSLNNAVREIKANSPKIDIIQSDSEETNKNTKSILNVVRNLSKSVRTMIIIVSVAFSLVTVAYLFVRNSVDSLVDKKLESVVFTPDERAELLKEIEGLRKQIKELHKEPSDRDN